MRLEARIIGRVQGVFFRQFTYEKARELELTGFVRNEPDYSVYLVAEGGEKALGELLEAVKKGPPAASVVRVEHSYSRSTGKFSEFRIER